MLATPRPLQEKAALFWHGHFATNEETRSATTARCSGRSNCSRRGGSATSMRSWSPSRRTRRCSPSSTPASTSRARPTRTSPGRSWNCSRWARGTTRRPTSVKEPARSRAGTSAAPSSPSTRRTTTRTRRRSSAAPVGSPARTSSRSSWNRTPRHGSWPPSSIGTSSGTISIPLSPGNSAHGCGISISRSPRSWRCCSRAATSTRPRPWVRASRDLWNWSSPRTASSGSRSCPAYRTSTS